MNVYCANTVLKTARRILSYLPFQWPLALLSQTVAKAPVQGMGWCTTDAKPEMLMQN